MRRRWLCRKPERRAARSESKQKTSFRAHGLQTWVAGKLFENANALVGQQICRKSSKSFCLAVVLGGRLKSLTAIWKVDIGGSVDGYDNGPGVTGLNQGFADF